MLVQTSGEDLLAAPSVRIGPTSCMRQRGARPGAMPLSAAHGPREVIMDSITLYNPPSLGAAGDRVRVVLAGAVIGSCHGRGETRACQKAPMRIP